MPSIAPLPNSSLFFDQRRASAYPNHGGDGGALGRQHPDECTDTARSQNRLPDALVVLPGGQLHRLHRDRVGHLVHEPRLDEQLGHREQADEHRHEGKPLVELVVAEHEPLDAGRPLGADGGEPHAEHAADEVLDRTAGADARQHRKAEQRQREVLRRAELVGDPRQQGRRHAQHDDREHAADGAGHDRHPERPPRLAALGEGIAVERGGRGGRRPGGVDQDGGDGAREGRRDVDGREHRDGVHRRHRQRERKQQRSAGGGAEPRQHADDHAEHGGGEDQRDQVGIEHHRGHRLQGIKHRGPSSRSTSSSARRAGSAPSGRCRTG